MEKLSEISLYNPNDKDLRKAFNIGFGVSAIFGRPLGVSLTSVLENNKDLNFNIHVFYDELPQEDIQKLKQTALKYKQTLFFHKTINQNDLFKKVVSDAKIWKATYYRLVAVSDMPGFVDRLLWLDSDICCHGSLKELFSIDMGNYPIAAVTHANQKGLVDDAIRRLGLKNKKYFNAGIILFNLRVWNSECFNQKTFSMIENPKEEWIIYDQDMFNSMIDGRYLELDYIYNYQRTNGCEKYNAIPKNIKIFHYIGPEKPWYVFKSEFSKEWMEYSSISFWNNVPLLIPERTHSNATLFRYMSKSSFKEKRVLDGIKYYYIYLYLKLRGDKN